MKQAIHNGEAVAYPLLVGMLLRGTASSGIAHFVSSSVIVNIVNLVEKNAYKRVEADDVEKNRDILHYLGETD
jgi:hypothetical protein